MSQQAVAEFFAKVNTDAALQQEVAKALEGKEDESMLWEAAASFAQVGALHGYDFTPEEAAAYYQERRKGSQKNQENGEELSDEALEMVAGGAANPCGGEVNGQKPGGLLPWQTASKPLSLPPTAPPPTRPPKS